MPSIIAPKPSHGSANVSEPADRTGRLGLYIHWPFCQAKCPYCDFNSHVSARIDQKRWASAYAREIERVALATGDRILSSVFFGGGTPSLMHPETVETVMRAIRANWSLANDFEATLEANPTSVEAAHFAAYRLSGVNRVSLGVQALDDSDLRRLGRRHTFSEARAALTIAQDTFERVSFDLIYARQDQTLAAWRAELSEALQLARGHLSLYQLTIEPGTAFGERHKAGGLKGLPEDSLAAELYEATQEMTEAAGLPAYEVSNHARPGQESAHNLIYWRSEDYLGIGPGAHGRLTFAGRRFATETPREPGLWLSAVEDGRADAFPIEELDERERLQERMIMGLRLREGVFIEDGSAGRTSLNPDALAELEASGHIELAGDRLRLTDKGRPLLDAILLKLL